MRLYPEQVADHLKKGLAPCYLVFGDDPLIKLETLDRLRHTAAEQGFTERHRFATDDGLDWPQLLDTCQSLSLFASRQIIELELGAKPPKEWAERIRELQGRLHPDLLLLLHGPRLSAAQSKSKWFEALNRLGVYVPVVTPETKQFSRWMQQRAQQTGLQLQPEALQLMCHAFEGNLLAAAQELEKLALLALPQPISLAVLQENITQHNHFTPFQLIDALLAGKVNRGSRILQQLREEGVEAGLLAWTLAREIEQLLHLQLAARQGQSLTQLFAQARIWQSRQALYQQALQRLPLPKLRQLLHGASELNRLLGRFEQEAAWLLLQGICLGFKEAAPLPPCLLDASEAP